jgi:HD-like signal output (HDOD) protein
MLHAYMMNTAPAIAPDDDLPRVLKAAAALGILGGAGMSAPRVLAALCNPQATNAAVSGLIAQEPGLAARVLKVANSAFYGRARSVTSIERALSVMGLDAVRGIAAAACLDRTVMRAPEGALIQRGALVTHSLAVGTAAEALARIQRRELAGDAFMAGLLHNLGVPIQAMLNPQGMKELIADLAADPGQDVRELERRHDVLGHEACATAVFESWQLPEPLIQAAAHHHHPQEAPAATRSLTWLVHFGLHVAHGAGFSFAVEPAHAECDSDTLALLGLSQAALDEVQAALPQRIAELQGALAG